MKRRDSWLRRWLTGGPRATNDDRVLLFGSCPAVLSWNDGGRFLGFCYWRKERSLRIYLFGKVLWFNSEPVTGIVKGGSE